MSLLVHGGQTFPRYKLEVFVSTTSVVDKIFRKIYEKFTPKPWHVSIIKRTISSKINGPICRSHLGHGHTEL